MARFAVTLSKGDQRFRPKRGEIDDPLRSSARR